MASKRKNNRNCDGSDASPSKRRNIAVVKSTEKPGSKAGEKKENKCVAVKDLIMSLTK